MKRWSIHYWNEGQRKNLEKWFDLLSEDEFKSIAKELKMLEIAGNTLRMPHSRALGSGLFELRDRKYGFRLYYAFRDQRIIVILVAGNKKSQKEDIENARGRLLAMGREEL